MQSYEYRKDYYEKRIKFYKEYLGNKCVMCGTHDNLEFDHKIAKDKLFVITSRHDAKWEIMKPELDKCQLLCSKCHIVKSQTEGDTKAAASHGSLGMYRHYKCRCTECKTAWNAYCKEWKRNNRAKIKASALADKNVSL